MRLLMDEHQRTLYAHIHRMLGDHDETDDVLQQTFIKAWRGLADFKQEAGLSTWLYRIATNASLDQLEKRKRFNPERSTETEADQLRADSPHPSAQEIESRLASAMDSLPPKQRQVFVMRYFDTLSYAQMSAITGTSEGALKSSYHLAVKKIELFLTSDQTF